ncbi:hypothetical protein [uncultured Halomonas sp.]|uniref:hypothetical protein n=1 Tax=uncultured Halomonas sp. TaxID=173971 RepID=UPI00263924BB|nr:hypothetical protein [uncultured Halomonas sp.]
MKKTLVALALSALTLSPTAVAATDNGVDWKEFCSLTSKCAEVIMTMRQRGVPVPETMAKFTAVYAEMPYLEDLVESMILEAYTLPRYSTEANRERSIEDFTNRKYTECASALRNK